MTPQLTQANDIHAHYAPWSQTIDLYLFQCELGPLNNRDIGVVARHPIRCELTVHGDESIPQSPTLCLNEITAQRLMDQLWHCGLRPTEGSGSSGSLAATQRHLEDMRTIAFSQLDIPNENDPQVSKVTR